MIEFARGKFLSETGFPGECKGTLEVHVRYKYKVLNRSTAPAGRSKTANNHTPQKKETEGGKWSEFPCPK